MKKGERIKGRIIIPTISVLIFVIICCLAGLFWIQQQDINEDTKLRIKGVEKLFIGFIEEEARFLREQIKNEQFAGQIVTDEEEEGVLYDYLEHLNNQYRKLKQKKKIKSGLH